MGLLDLWIFLNIVHYSFGGIESTEASVLPKKIVHTINSSVVDLSTTPLSSGYVTTDLYSTSSRHPTFSPSSESRRTTTKRISGGSKNDGASTVAAVSIPIIFIGLGGVVVFYFILKKYTQKKIESDYWNIQARPEPSDHDYAVLNINTNIQTDVRNVEPKEPDYQNLVMYKQDADSSSHEDADLESSHAYSNLENKMGEN